MRDARDEVADLQRLLDHAQIRKPYVQVGHWRSSPPARTPELRRVVATPVRDGVDLAAGEALARRVHSLGAIARRRGRLSVESSAS